PASSKNILVAKTEVEPAVPSHAQSCNCSPLAGRDGVVIAVYITDKLSGNKGFIAERRIHRTVPIPTAVTTVGTDNHHVVTVSQIGKVGCFLDPTIIATTVTM